jgi:restriction endonuclease S subunit
LIFGPQVHPRFGYYYCRLIPQQLLAAARNAVVPILNKSNFSKIEMPLPPRSEQQRIVKILDQADTLRRQRQTADDKAQRILPALFYKMFGDPATNPKGWPVKRLGDITLDKPQYGANASSKTWSEGDPRYVRITDITDDGRLLKTGITTLDLDEWETYRLVDGDLLFARSGNTVGKTYLYHPEDGLCAYAGYLIRFKPNLDQAVPWYLFALTQTDYYRGWVEARKRVAGQPNINGKEYASLDIPCPPVPLQRSFAQLAESYVSIRNTRGLTTEQLDHLFDVLLHRAYTGDLTAKWREEHKQQLEAEMQEQMAALEKAKANKPKRGRRRKAVK